ncbi:MAG: DUF2461 domain-containing protein [Flavisolibacter sp.]
MLAPQTLKYLSQLKKNNNKPWFERHRLPYEMARADFAAFIQMVIASYGKKNSSIASMTAKDCMFRINRDVRFSKDKTPYKSHFSAVLKKGGKKSIYAGYYFHCEPGASFIGGGIWMPTPEELKKIRQEIDYNWEAFQDCLSSKIFKKIYKDLYKDDAVSMRLIPKGYDKQNPAASYLKLKSLIAETRLSNEDLTSASLLKKTLNAFEALQPFIDFINEAVAYPQ